MKARHIVEMCCWLSRVSLLAYLALSVLLVIYWTSQSTSLYLSSAVLASLRGSGYRTRESILDTALLPEAFPIPIDNEYYHRMIQASAERSSQHQRKFLARKG